MDNYLVSPGNAWEMDMFDGEIGSKGRESRDEYFEKDDEGYYKLKDGYEQRYIGGSGDSLGAEMTYTTDWDDADKKKEYYGIYKTPEPRTITETVYQDKPVDAPEEKSLPIQLSDRTAQAIAGTQAYENEVLPRQGNYSIKDDQSVAQDFKNSYSINLANELKQKAPGVLENKAADIKQKDAYSLNLLK